MFNIIDDDISQNQTLKVYFCMYDLAKYMLKYLLCNKNEYFFLIDELSI